jgi:hypothetical protein
MPKFSFNEMNKKGFQFFKQKKNYFFPFSSKLFSPETILSIWGRNVIQGIAEEEN